MRIVLVTDSYPPEIRSASHLMYELAMELKDRGHHVTVATSWPRYNLDANLGRTAFEEFATEDGVEVLRIQTLPHHKVNYLVRGIAQVLMPYQFQRRIRRHVRDRIDAVIVYSPPLPLARVGIWLHRRGARFMLNLQDLFPRNAIDLGILRNPLLIAMFSAMERRAYRHADAISVHSPGNIGLVARGEKTIEEKVVTIPNWVAIPADDEPRAARDFRGELGLGGRFIAVFGGVVGPSQRLDMLLDAAAILKTRCPDLVILIVGEGTEKPRLQSRARCETLDNVIFRPFMKRADYRTLLATCQLGLVCLSAKNRTPVVPGKILEYMAMGLPVAAFLQASSDAHAMIAEACCGYSAQSNDPEAIASVLCEAYEHRKNLAILGANGRAYASDHFSRKVCVDAIEAALAGRP